MRVSCAKKQDAFDAAEQARLLRHPFVRLVLSKGAKTATALGHSRLTLPSKHPRRDGLQFFHQNRIAVVLCRHESVLKGPVRPDGARRMLPGKILRKPQNQFLCMSGICLQNFNDLGNVDGSVICRARSHNPSPSPPCSSSLRLPRELGFRHVRHANHRTTPRTIQPDSASDENCGPSIAR